MKKKPAAAKISCTTCRVFCLSPTYSKTSATDASAAGGFGVTRNPTMARRTKRMPVAAP